MITGFRLLNYNVKSHESIYGTENYKNGVKNGIIRSGFNSPFRCLIFYFRYFIDIS